MMKNLKSRFLGYATGLLAITAFLPSFASAQTSPFLTIPPKSTIVSATLSLYVIVTTTDEVTLHAITKPWSESAVTWNNFNDSFVTTPIANSTTKTWWDWTDFNVTSLVQKWVNGTVPNYGFLLEQDLAYTALDYTSTVYHSSEISTIALRPKLEIQFMLNNKVETILLQRGTKGFVADSYIWDTYPDANEGSSERISTRIKYAIQKKRGLIRFAIPVVPCNCKGGINQLTVKYTGTAPAKVEVFADKNGQQNNPLFSKLNVQPGELINLVGHKSNGTMGVEINLWANDTLQGMIHTSCSKPVGPGQVAGDFLVIEGFSKDGGVLCPYAFQMANWKTKGKKKPKSSKKPKSHKEPKCPKKSKGHKKSKCSKEYKKSKSYKKSKCSKGYKGPKHHHHKHK